jgi:cytochrome c biogenesis protein CcmG/thiol:disulfide interchange protein DsbE
MNSTARSPGSFGIWPLVFGIACLLLLVGHMLGFFWPHHHPADIALPEGVAVTLLSLDGEPRRQVALDQPAPDFIVVDSTRRRLRLSDLRGKPVVLNFWATWCTPCKAEMPALQALYAEAGEGASFELLAINMREAPEPAAIFGADLGLTFPLVIDLEGALARSYQVTALPTTIVIDAEGIVRVQHLGPLDREQLRELLATYS